MSVVIIGGNECMVRNALSETKGQDVKVVRSHTSSMSALKNILEENAKQDFAVKETSDLLEEYGYSVDDLGKCITQLSRRLNESDDGRYMVMSKMRKRSLNDIENAQVYIALNGQMEKALNSSQ